MGPQWHGVKELGVGGSDGRPLTRKSRGTQPMPRTSRACKAEGRSTRNPWAVSGADHRTNVQVLFVRSAGLVSFHHKVVARSGHWGKARRRTARRRGIVTCSPAQASVQSKKILQMGIGRIRRVTINSLQGIATRKSHVHAGIIQVNRMSCAVPAGNLLTLHAP